MLPVTRGGNLVFIGQLQRVDNPQHFVKVTAGAGGVGDHQPNLLVRINHEQGAYSQAAVGVGMNHVVQLGHFAILVCDDREVHRAALGFVDVLDPFMVRVHRVHAQGDGFDVAFGKLVLKFGGQAQLSGAYWREVSRMREQNAPAVAQPVIKRNFPFTGLLLKIRRGVSET